MARFPQPVAVLGLAGPGEAAAAVRVGDRLHRLGLLREGGRRAVELDEEGGRGGQPLELGVGDAGGELHLVQQLDPRHGDAGLHHLDHRLHRVGEGGELAHGGAHGLGDAVQAQPYLGDDSKRALGADEEAREVVAVGGLARAAAGGDDAPVGEDDLEAQHVLADRAVAHGIGPRGARRAHAADGAVAARVHREEQAPVAQVLVELLAGDAGLDETVHVLGADLLDGGHAREVEGDAAADRVHVALERGAGAEGGQRHGVGVADARDVGHLLGGLGEGDGVGQGRRGGVLAAGVLGAHRLVEGEAVAEAPAQRGDGGVRGRRGVRRGGAGGDGVHGVLVRRASWRAAGRLGKSLERGGLAP